MFTHGKVGQINLSKPKWGRGTLPRRGQNNLP